MLLRIRDGALQLYEGARGPSKGSVVISVEEHNENKRNEFVTTNARTCSYRCSGLLPVYFSMNCMVLHTKYSISVMNICTKHIFFKESSLLQN